MTPRTSTAPPGHLDDIQLTWLDHELKRRRDVPTLLCMHHPPMPVGIPVLDAIRLAQPDRLAAVLSKHQAPIHILAGHVHRAITGQFAGRPVSIAPSTYRQVDLAMQPGRRAPYVHEPAGFLLHLHDPETRVSVTHLVPTSHTSAAFATV